MTTIGIAHNRDLCHCSGCERFNRSLATRMFTDVGPKVLLVATIMYFVGHVLVWISRGYPGLMRVGGM